MTILSVKYKNSTFTAGDDWDEVIEEDQSVEITMSQPIPTGATLAARITTNDTGYWYLESPTASGNKITGSVMIYEEEPTESSFIQVAVTINGVEFTIRFAYNDNQHLGD